MWVWDCLRKYGDQLRDETVLAASVSHGPFSTDCGRNKTIYVIIVSQGLVGGYTSKHRDTCLLGCSVCKGTVWCSRTPDANNNSA